MNIKKGQYHFLLDCKNTEICFCKQLDQFDIQYSVEESTSDKILINLKDNIISSIVILRISKGTSKFAPVYYEIKYNIEREIKDKDTKKFKAKLVKKTEGFLSSKVVDLTWKGGLIANNLNIDQTLRSQLLEDLAFPFYIANAVFKENLNDSEAVFVNTLKDEFYSSPEFKTEWNLMRRIEKLVIHPEKDSAGIKIKYKEFTSPIPSQQLMNSISQIGKHIKEIEI